MELPSEAFAAKLLREVCTLGIGGMAELYQPVDSIEKMQQIMRRCAAEKMRYFILGKGSNTLFDDQGFQGLVIHNKIDFLEEIGEGIFRAGAGYSFSLLGTQTARKGWSGLEFASGIPASVGGAVFMNAGANGTDTSTPLLSVDYVEESGQLLRLDKRDLAFAYRHSSFQTRKGAIVAATFQLQHSPKARERQLEILAYRTRTQPYGEKSAGCMFRNPQCESAGALIEQSGLKGARIGGAEVSRLHANFLINTGHATTQEMLQLIRHIQTTVRKKTGIALEPEVRVVPYLEEQ